MSASPFQLLVNAATTESPASISLPPAPPLMYTYPLFKPFNVEAKKEGDSAPPPFAPLFQMPNSSAGNAWALRSNTSVPALQPFISLSGAVTGSLAPADSQRRHSYVPIAPMPDFRALPHSDVSDSPDEIRAEKRRTSAGSPNSDSASSGQRMARMQGMEFRPQDSQYEEKRAKNNEAVRKCRSKKRAVQQEKEHRLIYLERGMS